MNATAQDLLKTGDPCNATLQKEIQAFIQCGNSLLLTYSTADQGINKTYAAAFLDACTEKVGVGVGTGFDQHPDGTPNLPDDSSNFGEHLKPYLPNTAMLLTSYHISTCVVPKVLNIHGSDDLF